MTFYKNIWFYIAAAIAAIAVFGGLRGCKLQRQYKAFIQQQNDSISHYKDKQGRVHTVKEVMQIPESLYKHITDSLVANISKDVKAKDLVQHSEVLINTHNTDTVKVYDTIVVTAADTLPARVFRYNDKALQLSGLLWGDQVDINYNFNVHLSHTTKWHRAGFLRKKKLVVDVFSNTPHTSITGLQTFVVQQPPKKWYETRAAAIGLGAIIGFAARGQIK